MFYTQPILAEFGNRAKFQSKVMDSVCTILNLNSDILIKVCDENFCFILSHFIEHVKQKVGYRYGKYQTKGL